MKICRFINKNQEQYGALHNNRVFPFPDTNEFGDLSETLKLIESFELSEIKLLPPATPTKIVCVGRNYAEHAAELGNEVPKEPLLFLKAPSALITEGEAIVIPEQSKQVEHEGELAVVIGRECGNLSENDNPFEYVFGYTCLNDVTARDLQRRDVQFTRAKSFDTFCPIGAFIETELDVSDLRVVTKVNGLVKQDGRTSQMVFPVDFLIRYISNMMTLKAGDIIATGTPSGVSKLNPGDLCEVEIEGVGSLRNPVEEGI
ncbi:MAG TPA: fumarylacetoacetate hydrolase family protein [Pyrinomonadaceae bacterium]|jgi:2-keto-4-pentenoate hydratase/2-oxohepta-3-ene-1,7-dioic acid hydratase in catechol pathway